MKATVLVLVSNVQAADLISFALSREDYHIIRAQDGRTGMRLMRTRKPDIVLLDLPEGMDPDSLDMCDQVKEESLDSPILMFATESEADLAAILQIDYIIKPFSIHDLLDRVNLVLLRTERMKKPPIQRLGRITIDTRRAEVRKDDVPLKLSQQEYDIMRCLSSEPGRAFSHRELLEYVWNYTGYSKQDVNVAIRRLRMKIEDDPSKPSIILTRRKQGYLLVQQ